MDGIHVETFTGLPVTNITLENCDIEHVNEGYSCILFKGVYKFTINNLVVNQVSVNADIIRLLGCKDGMVYTPWIADSTPSTKYVTVNSICENIYLFGFRRGVSTKIGFSSNDGNLIPLSCVNVDDVLYKQSVSYLMKKDFNRKRQ